MDPALDFAISGPNMEFGANLAAYGHSIPDLLFVYIIAEKCGMIRDHIRSHTTSLMLIANIRPKKWPL